MILIDKSVRSKPQSSLIFGKIKYVKDEIVTSTGFTNATPHSRILLDGCLVINIIVIVLVKEFYSMVAS